VKKLNQNIERWQNSLSGLHDPLPEKQRNLVFQCSEFAANQFIQNRNEYLDLWEKGFFQKLVNSEEMEEMINKDLRLILNEENLIKSLRKFRNQQMVRIIWQDLCGLADIEQTMKDLSNLGEICVKAALDKLFQWEKEKKGTPRDLNGKEQNLIILAMGKLGAQELNMSSDIDLIYCFPSHGSTDGPQKIENEKFFLKLAQKLGKVLSLKTPDGFVFRVDLRLRPFGSSGPLVISFNSMEKYLRDQARAWERYAMVKARAITGSSQEKQFIEGKIKAFVYRSYVDYGVIEPIRKIKQRIDFKLNNGKLDSNIKVGWGGIREIEFLGQAFQLVRGGRDLDLQERSILLILGILGNKDFLKKDTIIELKSAYIFLRRVENRLQAWRDEQTHEIPNEDSDRIRLAISMGFKRWDDFSLILDEHRNIVHKNFNSLFETSLLKGTDDQLKSNPIWLNDNYKISKNLLKDLGFYDPKITYEILHKFKSSNIVDNLSDSGKSKLDQLIPTILDILAHKDNNHIILSRLLSLFETLVKRTTYLDLLVENPKAIAQLIKLMGESSWISSQIKSLPILLDNLLDPERLYTPMRQEELTLELNSLVKSVPDDDEEQEMERIRQFALGNKLRVAAAEITGAIPLMIASDYLTEIAEVSLKEVFKNSWKSISNKFGKPTLPNEMNTGFAIIAYGKFGGIELGYSSDLDMVFLHGSDNVEATTNGDRKINNDIFFTRLGQRIIHLFMTRMSSGLLYNVDVRLRPNGESGQLVSSLNAFERYQKNEAWTWEHQALIRARVITGDKEVIRKFKEIRKSVLCLTRDNLKLREDVKIMRKKMAKKLDRSDKVFFDIKQGSGGLVDIEFIVQYLVLKWASRYPELADWTDNARILENLEKYDLLEGSSSNELFLIYSRLRGLIHKYSLQELEPMIPQKELKLEREKVIEMWNVLFF
tara:strand:+ start:140 stop:2950 length:2811 start_codon:yes stop_codon:yes gene_type:complete